MTPVPTNLTTHVEDGILWVAHDGSDIAAVLPASPGQSRIRFVASLSTRALPEWVFRTPIQVPTIWVMAWIAKQVEAQPMGVW